MINIKDEIKFEFNESNHPSESFRVHWTVPENLAYFQGHFPNNPILPAVAIIDVSLEVLRTVHPLKSIALSSIKSCKFRQPITPKQDLEIGFDRNPNGDWAIEWFYLNPKKEPLSVAHLIFSLSGF